MFETIAAVVIGAGFVITVRLITGPDTGEAPLASLLGMQPMSPRPRGVQEEDLAPFTFPASRPAATDSPATGTVTAIEPRLEPARAA